jgi:hypothetical protein
LKSRTLAKIRPTLRARPAVNSNLLHIPRGGGSTSSLYNEPTGPDSRRGRPIRVHRSVPTRRTTRADARPSSTRQQGCPHTLLLERISAYWPPVAPGAPTPT